MFFSTFHNRRVEETAPILQKAELDVSNQEPIWGVGTSSARAANKRDNSVRFLSFARLGGLPESQVATARQEVPTSRENIQVKFVCRQILDIGSRQDFAGGGACTFHLATKFLNTGCRDGSSLFLLVPIALGPPFPEISGAERLAMRQEYRGRSHATYRGNPQWSFGHRASSCAARSGRTRADACHARMIRSKTLFRSLLTRQAGHRRHQLQIIRAIWNGIAYVTASVGPVRGLVKRYRPFRDLLWTSGGKRRGNFETAGPEFMNV
jgi:hypothetical protein